MILMRTFSSRVLDHTARTAQEVPIEAASMTRAIGGSANRLALTEQRHAA